MMKRSAMRCWRSLVLIVLTTFAICASAADSSYPTKPIRWLVPFARGRTGSRRMFCCWGGDGALPPGWWHSVLRALLLPLVASGCVSSQAAFAQTYPTKPIRWLVPFAPGGVGDLTARIVSQKMTEHMGQQIVIENRPGAGMIMSATAALQSPADGYTLVQAGNGTAISQTLFKSLPYSIVKDFTEVSTLAYFDLVVVTNSSSHFASTGDIVAFAKKNPGKLSLGTISAGSTQYLAAALFISMAGIDAQTVPFKGSPAVINAVRGNEIPLAFEFIPGVIGQLKSGALKAIAVGSSRRSPLLPDTPTIAESGVPNYQATSWTGIAVRMGTPSAIIERLHREIVAAVNAPEVKQKLQDLGATAGASASPEEARKLMASEIEKWKIVIQRANLKPN